MNPCGSMPRAAKSVAASASGETGWSTGDPPSRPGVAVAQAVGLLANVEGRAHLVGRDQIKRPLPDAVVRRPALREQVAPAGLELLEQTAPLVHAVERQLGVGGDALDAEVELLV